MTSFCQRGFSNDVNIGVLFSVLAVCSFTHSTTERIKSHTFDHAFISRWTTRSERQLGSKMGLFLTKLYDVFQGFSTTSPARILMVGLDAAGKTTILYKVKLNENVSTIPTIGFNVETVSPTKGVTFTVWDIGGQDKIRPLWRYYFQNTEGLIYVVDSSDGERIDESRDELFEVLNDDQMRNVPVVGIANKQDLPNAMGPAKIVDALELRKLGIRKWHVQGACAVNGEGIYEAMDTMARLVKAAKANY